ncbi:GntR family transcriptional regulator [Cellulomonas hominis]|uniref:GntR family transcriptional regulator n=1 Tax=Cellulomonas hominis TaxID=156981 RepID=A0A511FAN5_9CELL|nr:GntR family transcriptional regulator [Cellulomonas hominis]MBB5473378.1 GntR family transcriptional regulator [Cellulomonas hominis]MBU5421310.1 GntR family transcriptional regulator [Cellulomonas hominis]NKY06726.1 GntR family transcriptional regulator [Cellulomonas hominis]NKY09088.1 GntR family transcriptional regulator [Cellulomonas hominis]GEL45337.1 HTH-type transcriptional repressor DasR [Cellulomonas hominis]
MTALTRDVVGSPPPSVAKYAWLKAVLVDHIDRRLAPGDPVPSERELADGLDVSRMTARRALSELVAEGRIKRVPGRGSFVNEPTIRLPIQLTSFTNDMQQRGYTSGARTLDSGVVHADDWLSSNLDVPRGHPVLRIVRLRTADNQPVAIERVHLNADVVPGLEHVDLTNRSLYSVLADRYSIVFDGGRQSITARLVDPDDAGHLDLAAGSAVLHLVRTSTWRGRLVEYTVSAYRGDRYELSSAL